MRKKGQGTEDGKRVCAWREVKDEDGAEIACANIVLSGFFLASPNVDRLKHTNKSSEMDGARRRQVFKVSQSSEILDMKAHSRVAIA